MRLLMQVLRSKQLVLYNAYHFPGMSGVEGLAHSWHVAPKGRTPLCTGSHRADCVLWHQQ